MLKYIILYNVQNNAYNILYNVQIVYIKIIKGCEHMNNLNLVIADNLKKIREKRKLSLDKVAELTGISKSMIGQIERGESNPSITTVCKLANGLKVQVTSFIVEEQPNVVVIDKGEITPLTGDEGKYRLYPVFPFEERRNFELFYMEVEVNEFMNCEPHLPNTNEFVTVFSGELKVIVGEDEYVLKKGDSISFISDKPHSYHNIGTVLVEAHMTVHYNF